METFACPRDLKSKAMKLTFFRLFICNISLLLLYYRTNSLKRFMVIRQSNERKQRVSLWRLQVLLLWFVFSIFVVSCVLHHVRLLKTLLLLSSEWSEWWAINYHACRSSNFINDFHCFHCQNTTDFFSFSMCGSVNKVGVFASLQFVQVLFTLLYLRRFQCIFNLTWTEKQ